MSVEGGVEIEVKIRYPAGAGPARELIQSRGFSQTQPRTLESDTLFDRNSGELRQADRLLRLRREDGIARVTYKGPSRGERYKAREEIEFDVSDADHFALVLDRLGYLPRWRYEKYRTEFAAPGETGAVTIDETPIGVFLELEGPPAWIDRAAARLGFSAADYIASSYAVLYREYRLSNSGAPENMTF